jgi:chromosome partitioning protein
MAKKPKPLRSIAVSSVKGGTGKTSTVIHTGTSAALAGERVLILDADPQGSCVLWSGLRDGERPRIDVEGIDAAAVPQRITRAAEEQYTLCLVDTTPRTGNALASVLAAVSFVVVPIRPQLLDLGTLAQSLAIVQAAGARGCTVLTMCPSRAAETAQTRAVIGGLALPVAPVEIGERRAFGRALAMGLGIAEVDPDGQAAQEIAALWRYVQKAMT